MRIVKCLDLGYTLGEGPPRLAIVVMWSTGGGELRFLALAAGWIVVLFIGMGKSRMEQIRQFGHVELKNVY